MKEYRLYTASDDSEAVPVLDLDGAGKFLELSRSEMLVLVPEAMLEIGGKLDLTREAMASGSLADAGRSVHTIKSVAASIGAQRTSQIARDFEVAARGCDGDQCVVLLPVLEAEVSLLAEEVDKL